VLGSRGREDVNKRQIPGRAKALPKDFEVDEKQIGKVEAIICSMTRRERVHPGILNGSRRKRIAQGSGVQVSDVNRLIKQVDEAKTMMKKMGGMKGKMRRLPMGLGR